VTDTQHLKKTPLHDRHLAAGARMVAFAGFEMPVQYRGVVAEHEAVRGAVGLFDVSHMGEVELRGPRAVEVADRILTNHIGKLEDGQACYTCMCRPDGGIVDDLVVYRVSSAHVFICVNAANREKDFAYMEEVAGGDCALEDTGDAWAQIAVQGPKAPQLVDELTSAELSAVRSYRFIRGEVAGAEGLIARTGYTGEDGFELYVPAARAGAVWDALMTEGEPLGVEPAGLGARDSLRLEMCLPLYGNDIDETTNPYEAGLGWVVKLKKPGDFAGRAALEAAKAAGPERKLVPLRILGRGIARQGYSVLDASGHAVGAVTSGTRGPSVNEAIALAYVPTSLASEGTQLAVEVRGRPVEAVVARRPFLKR
jgi:aminomethyltransferase